MHGLNTLKHQPAKVAAMEGLWETTTGAPLNLFGWPDQEAEKTKYAIEIPKLSSLILTHDLNGKVVGLKAWPKEDRPPVWVVFWCFRIMVGLGTLMILTGLTALVLYLKKQLFEATWFHYWCMAMTPAGFVAVLAGWFVTEVGRQPYIIYGVMRATEARLAGGGFAHSHVRYGLCSHLWLYFRCRNLLYFETHPKGPGFRRRSLRCSRSQEAAVVDGSGLRRRRTPCLASKATWICL